MSAAEAPRVPLQRTGELPQATRQPLRVAVVDDHTVVSELLGMVIAAESDLELVGRASSVAECERRFADWRADVILMDVRLGDGDGLALTAELTAQDPRLRVLVLTAFADAALLRRAVESRASALMPKDGDLGAVLQGIRTAQAREQEHLVVHPSLAQHLVNHRAHLDRPSLTAREQEVLRMLAAGMDARQIGHEIGVTLHTCRGHVKSILAKLGAHSQLEAVAKAMRMGLISALVE